MGKDIKTFGRKAKVQYTDNLKEDAKRRDFTFNTIYLNPKSVTIFFDYIALQLQPIFTVFKLIINSNLTKAFWQIRMDKTSSKYMGIITPYKGLRVYTRDAMGRVGASETLDDFQGEYPLTNQKIKRLLLFYLFNNYKL